MTMMKNCDQSVEINHSLNWPYSPDHSYRILVIGGSGSRKTNVSLNFIKYQRPHYNKLICTSKIYSNQSMNCLLIREKNKELKY